MSKILIAEDDAFLSDGLCELLKKEQYDVTCVNRADEMSGLDPDSFDLLILDVMLPDGDGFSICSSIRQSGSSVPILFLTACDDELQIVRGLDAGGDDYVTKPFKLLELLSRIRALLRRNSRIMHGVRTNAEYCSGDITIDTESMAVRKNGSTVYVTPTEFQILSMLIRNSGIIVTREKLLENIWDDAGSFIDDNTLSVHVSRLREKIGAQHIKTVRGVGYRWEENI